MKKTISIVLVIFICVSASVFILSSCNNKKHEVYNIDTELGDKLSLEVYLSGNLHGMYLTYFIYSDNFIGGAIFRFRDKTVIPDNPLEKFEIIGSYGNTHFYKLYNEILFVYNNERVGQLNSAAKLNGHIFSRQYKDNESIERLSEVLTDLIKTGNFDYIYQFGVILAYEGNDDIKLLLQRYADGNFSEEELSVNENSVKTTEEMTSWAKDLLNEYYLP